MTNGSLSLLAPWMMLLLGGCVTTLACGAWIRMGLASVRVAPSSQNPFHASGYKVVAGIVPVLSATLVVLIFVHGESEAIPAVGAVVALSLVGLIDDSWRLGPGRKVLAQLPVLLWINVALPPFGPDDRVALIVFRLLYLVIATNALNVIDVADGLAPGVGAISLGAIAFLLFDGGHRDLALVAAAFGGSAAGFLWLNLRGIIILGDSGSLALGGLLAILAPHCSPALTPAGIAVSSLLMFVPLSEVVWLSFSRLRAGIPPWIASPHHIAYRLVARGMHETHAVASLLGAQALAAGAALWIG